jgi:hypothetical protein
MKWILILTFLTYGDPSARLPHVDITSVEFDTKSACETAKENYLNSIKDRIDLINKVVQEKKEVGEFQGIFGANMDAICVQK